MASFDRVVSPTSYMFVKCASIIIHVGLAVAVVVGAVVTTINIVVSTR